MTYSYNGIYKRKDVVILYLKPNLWIPAVLLDARMSKKNK